MSGCGGGGGGDGGTGGTKAVGVERDGGELEIFGRDWGGHALRENPPAQQLSWHPRHS